MWLELIEQRGKVNFVVGPNGVGKSALIDEIELGVGPLGEKDVKVPKKLVEMLLPVEANIADFYEDGAGIPSRVTYEYTTLDGLYDIVRLTRELSQPRVVTLDPWQPSLHKSVRALVWNWIYDQIERNNQELWVVTHSMEELESAYTVAVDRGVSFAVHRLGRSIRTSEKGRRLVHTNMGADLRLVIEAKLLWI